MRRRCRSVTGSLGDPVFDRLLADPEPLTDRQLAAFDPVRVSRRAIREAISGTRRLLAEVSAGRVLPRPSLPLVLGALLGDYPVSTSRYYKRKGGKRARDGK